ncbi:MAG: RloB family protein [Cyanobacteriota bacterium]|nr:RloB family protein [Cyanobacteriota bacterium]
MARNKQQSKSSKKTSSSSKSRLSKKINQTANSREVKEARDVFLIVCEGEKTEPNYFKNFPIPSYQIDVINLGNNPIYLVKKAIEISKQGKEYEQVWCVFDRDDYPPNDFNGAITCAKENEIKIAYSNEAFELWYLLHFYYRDTAMSRKSYEGELTKKLREAKLISKSQKYEKNSEEMYGFLEDKQGRAIKNAKRLLKEYNPPNPAKDNPSTTVHLLVEQLNRFVRGN